jgi:hypothetical protein
MDDEQILSVVMERPLQPDIKTLPPLMLYTPLAVGFQNNELQWDAISLNTF